LYLVYAYAVV